MKARIAKSLDVLRSQVNTTAPTRSKASDGWIGDTAHASRKSDHNPNEKGVVNALDITHDPSHGVDIQVLGEALIASKDARIKYLIFNGKIVSGDGGVQPWKFRNYTGANKHTKHIHISVKDGIGDNAGVWALGKWGTPAAAAAITDKPTVEHVQRRLVELGYTEVGGVDGIAGAFTRTAILAFRKDNGLELRPDITKEMLEVLRTAQPRQIDTRRENASAALVTEKVPEAKAHWWTKWIAGATTAATAVSGVTEAASPSLSYVERAKELAGGVPGWVWLAVIAGIALVIFLIARKGEQASVEAFRDGSRR